MGSLGGVELPESIVVSGDEFPPAVAAASEITLGGKHIWWEAPVSSGQKLDLVAQEDAGWLTRAQVEALHALASVPGGVYTLTVGDRISAKVRFRHEDAPALDLQPLITPGQNKEDSPWWTGTIKLVRLI